MTGERDYIMDKCKSLYEARQLYSGYFFTRDTKQFWGSTNATDLIHGYYFITKEDNFNRTKKLFTIRKFTSDYQNIKTVGEFQAYSTLHQARTALQAILLIKAV